MAKASARGRSPQPPLVAEKQPFGASVAGSNKSKKAKKNASYKSDGVEDNDIFLLPGPDYVAALGVTVLATIVRLYKIYMPTSVVFDEVQ
jgi:dolichyl-phosphate-mannose-protein mannosyltransferase